MSFLTWHLRHALDGQRKWLVGGTLIGLLSLTMFFNNIGLENRRAQLEATVRAMKSQVSQAPEVGESSLQRMEKTFPPSSELTAQQQRIHDIAEKNGVQINQINFALSKLPETALVTYKMNFSFSADYERMRQFISDFLVENPNASLEKIEFSRENNKTKVINTQLTITFFYREQ